MPSAKSSSTASAALSVHPSSPSVLTAQTFRSTARVADIELDEQGRANYEAARRSMPAQAIVDMAALKGNMKRLVEAVGGPESGTAVLGVVKADAYGHGLVPTALAALAGGAAWLGTAKVSEALLLRQAGIGPDRCHIIGWMSSAPAAPLDQLIVNDVDMGIGSFAGIDAALAAARRTARPARIHVAVDTGFGRNGFMPDEFDAALDKLVAGKQAGLLDVVGVYSHLAVADAPNNAAFVANTDDQVTSFSSFVDRMTAAGVPPRIRHLANTAATFTRPNTRFEMVRPGNGLYGYEADPCMGTSSDFGLTPAMSLQAQLGTVKRVPAGQAISYGRTYSAPQATSIAIVPLGYADGIQRSASGFDEQGALGIEHLGGPVRVITKNGPRLCRVSGRVCMDQFLIDLHGYADDLDVREGDTVQLFAPGRGADDLEPTADDWAANASTINYVIYTCLRNRIPRLYLHARDVLSESDLALMDPRSILS